MGHRRRQATLPVTVTVVRINTGQRAIDTEKSGEPSPRAATVDPRLIGRAGQWTRPPIARGFARRATGAGSGPSRHRHVCAAKRDAPRGPEDRLNGGDHGDLRQAGIGERAHDCHEVEGSRIGPFSPVFSRQAGGEPNRNRIAT